MSKINMFLVIDTEAPFNPVVKYNPKPTRVIRDSIFEIAIYPIDTLLSGLEIENSGRRLRISPIPSKDFTKIVGVAELLIESTVKLFVDYEGGDFSEYEYVRRKYVHQITVYAFLKAITPYIVEFSDTIEPYLYYAQNVDLDEEIRYFKKNGEFLRLKPVIKIEPI